MIAKAFVLIQVEVDKADKVKNSIGQLKGVTSVDKTTGPYDIIAMIERKSLTDIGELVTTKICAVAGISRTVTCLAVEL